MIGACVTRLGIRQSWKVVGFRFEELLEALPARAHLAGLGGGVHGLERAEARRSRVDAASLHFDCGDKIVALEHEVELSIAVRPLQDFSSQLPSPVEQVGTNGGFHESTPEDRVRTGALEGG